MPTPSTVVARALWRVPPVAYPYVAYIGAHKHAPTVYTNSPRYVDSISQLCHRVSRTAPLLGVTVQKPTTSKYQKKLRTAPLLYAHTRKNILKPHTRSPS